MGPAYLLKIFYKERVNRESMLCYFVVLGSSLMYEFGDKEQNVYLCSVKFPVL